MPQEVINSPYPGSPWRARVGWARDGGEVQLAVETFDERTLIGTLIDDVDRETFGTAVRGLMAADGLELDDSDLGAEVVSALCSVAPYLAVWATMDRTGANRLIRMIRTARDAAFGKDE